MLFYLVIFTANNNCTIIKAKLRTLKDCDNDKPVGIFNLNTDFVSTTLTDVVTGFVITAYNNKHLRRRASILVSLVFKNTH